MNLNFHFLRVWQFQLKQQKKLKLFVLNFYEQGTAIGIKRKNRLLKACYVPATSATFLAFFSFFLAVAINSTNEANKAGSMGC
jgi:hypothetical protein